MDALKQWEKITQLAEEVKASIEMSEDKDHIQEDVQEKAYKLAIMITQLNIQDVKPIKKCHECGALETPQWRRGSQGEQLCNKCGLAAKTMKKPKREDADEDADKKSLSYILN